MRRIYYIFEDLLSLTLLFFSGNGSALLNLRLSQFGLRSSLLLPLFFQSSCSHRQTSYTQFLVYRYQYRCKAQIQLPLCLYHRYPLLVRMVLRLLWVMQHYWYILWQHTCVSDLYTLSPTLEAVVS